MKHARLGVNIDHVATLRQARKESYPSLVQAAHQVLDGGADQITIHLREDRRHIQDTDVQSLNLVTQKYGVPLNLEMGCDSEIIEIAKASSPQWICLVPEKREEMTTEGGLNLNDHSQFQKISKTIDILKKSLPQLKVSLFVEAEVSILEKSCDLPIDAVEIHTGDFARAVLEGGDYRKDLEHFKKMKEFVVGRNVSYHAGHGLTDESLKLLLESKLFEEYNIGHWIVAQSLFEGLYNVTSRLKKMIGDFPTEL